MPHDADRDDTVLAELSIHDLHLPRDVPERTITFRVWINDSDLVIRRKKLHIRYAGELYEVSRMKQPFCGLTGIDYWQASRFIPLREGSGPAGRSVSA